MSNAPPRAGREGPTQSLPFMSGSVVSRSDAHAATLSNRLVSLARSTMPLAQLGVRRVLGRKSPFQMTFSLTNRCNFRCVYCEIPLQEREEMSTAEWCRAADELKAGGLGRVSLIGGEPLVRKDVGAIIRHLKSSGIHVAMNTNGWLVPSRIEDVALLDLVCVTLDGPPEVHDRQRHPGSYERVIDALILLRSRGVPVVTMTVLTSNGAGAIDHVLNVASHLGCRAYFQLEHDASCDVNAPISPALTDDRIKGLAEYLLDLKECGLPVGNSRTLLQAQSRARYVGTCADCHAGRYYGYVFSDGTVAPCLLTQRQVETGNGRRMGFLRAFEALAAPQGPGCSCLPTHEVNHILDFNVGVLWNALETVLGSTRSNGRTT
jgi:MoaA/NifB/PqqE/SkfB family radical SAM enzyme